MLTAETHSTPRLMRMPEVMSATGLKKTAIQDLVARKRFPQPVKLTDSARPPIGWLDSEIAEWVRERAERNRAA